MKTPGSDVAAGTRHLGNCLEELRMADTVEEVDPKSQAQQQLSRHVELMYGRNAGDILLRRTQRELISAHQAVRASVDQDHRVDPVVIDEPPIRFCQRYHAHFVEAVYGRRVALLLQPSGEVYLRKI